MLLHLRGQRYRVVVCDGYSWIAPWDDLGATGVLLRQSIVVLLGVEFYGLREPRVLSLGQPTPSPVPGIGARCADRRGVKSHA